MMDSFDDNTWDLLDSGSFIDDVAATDLYWSEQNDGLHFDVAFNEATTQDDQSKEKECHRKRARNDTCNRLGTKACRERLRREKLNERFLELSTVLEPGKLPKNDKLAILGDAIRVVNHLRAESQEFKETNEELLQEIKSLKAEKNELREEKLALKAEKERVEKQLKSVASPPPAGFMPPPAGYMPPPPHHPAAYHYGANKMAAAFPSYGYLPMWHYMPQSTVDTSKDEELRPPAA